MKSYCCAHSRRGATVQPTPPPQYLLPPMRSVVTGYVSARSCPVSRCSPTRDAFLCQQPIWLSPQPPPTPHVPLLPEHSSPQPLHRAILCPSCSRPLLHLLHLGTPLPLLRRALHFFSCTNVQCASGACVANGQLRSLVVVREQVSARCQRRAAADAVAGVRGRQSCACCCCCCCACCSSSGVHVRPR